jgi:hypothetical protein
VGRAPPLYPKELAELLARARQQQASGQYWAAIEEYTTALAALAGNGSGDA